MTVTTKLRLAPICAEESQQSGHSLRGPSLSALLYHALIEANSTGSDGGVVSRRPWSFEQEMETDDRHFDFG